MQVPPLKTPSFPSPALTSPHGPPGRSHHRPSPPQADLWLIQCWDILEMGKQCCHKLTKYVFIIMIHPMETLGAALKRIGPEDQGPRNQGPGHGPGVPGEDRDPGLTRKDRDQVTREDRDQWIREALYIAGKLESS